MTTTRVPNGGGARLRRLPALVLVAGLALSTAGCLSSRGPATTGSIDPARLAAASDTDLRGASDTLARRNAADPGNAQVAMAYAQVLRRLDQRAQAVAVLQQASLRNADDKALAGAYGRALADAGRLQEAQEVLARAHSPQNPDWRVLSAQGAVADQLGDPARAQRFYQAALNLVPGEPTVLSNYGLSLALSDQLPRAEVMLRQAAAHPDADARVRQNLALVLGLQGKMDDAETVLARDLPPAAVAANLDAIRTMVAQPNSWERLRRAEDQG
ncbi:hypothetical protein [Salinarimonas chemoclinalis]|uniref:hypothetical protein n=1 Tax=Salinarimonas chemoclinalis TaxID=3241599 RepID=UPI0035560353